MEPKMEEIVLTAKPENVDYLEITSSLEVIPSYRVGAEVYIKAEDISFLKDADTRRKIRETYGSRVGIIYDDVPQIDSRSVKPDKMILGVIRNEGDGETDNES